MGEGSIDGGARPLYISCVFWGEEFRDHFIDYFIPALLAPNNLPALTRPAKLLIATTPEDYALAEKTPQFARLKQYAEPVLFEIPLPPSGVNGCQHMGVGHLLMTERAFADKAYLCALVPDMMLSDGTLAFIDKKAREGYQAVLTTCIRVEQEGFLSCVRGAAGLDAELPADPCVIALSGRQMVRFSMDNLHSQGKTWNYDAPYFAQFPVAPFWPAHGGEGWLFHSLHWLPLLLDYSCVEEHDTSCLQNWTMDGDYLHDNFRGMRSWIVQNSDDAYVTSWSPADDRAVSLEFPPIMNDPTAAAFIKALHLHATFNNPIFDQLKQKLFFVPIRWHAGDTPVEEWERLESQVNALLIHWCGPESKKNLKYLTDYVSITSSEMFFRLINRCMMRIGLGPLSSTTRTALERLVFLVDCILHFRYRLLSSKVRRRLSIWGGNRGVGCSPASKRE